MTELNVTCGHPRWVGGCPGCQRLARLRNERRRTAIAAGTWAWRQPAREVAEHIEHLRKSGMHALAIAEASGVPVSTIYGVAHGRVGVVHGTTAQRILSVVAVETPPSGYVAVIGPRRRVQALAAIGHSLATQQRMCGVNRSTFQRLLYMDTRWTQAAHADAIREMFDKWSGTRGTSKLVVTTATRRGWYPPAAWDNIDDPSEVPTRYRRKDKTRAA